MKKLLFASTLTLAMSTPAFAQSDAPTCGDLVWSAQVLAANPDIAESCQGVYERGGQLYAKVSIELQRVRGNRLTFRPKHMDGSMGSPRSIVVDNAWRATIDGREYRARDLLAGQELSVYIPEDRFALAVADDMLAEDAEIELIGIEEAMTVTAMPTTASNLYTVLAGGLAFLGLGAFLTRRRKARIAVRR
jgi:LPXTG-motif cell wall-anchored protein